MEAQPGGWRFDNSYTRLPNKLFVRQAPVPVKRPSLILLNTALAAELGLDAQWLASDEGVRMLAGNTVVPGSEPIAQAYAGHQFGQFTMLGDGRALLLGEHIAPDGRRVDVQLKGSGRTPFSRGGDGRAAVGPMLREYVISEAMHALGIPTTRSLAVVATGEKVIREEPLEGAVLTRVASSHIRVGTFEFAGACGPDILCELLSYTLRRHFPTNAGSPCDALALIESAVESQAALLAQWMHVGFIHGVMNTDNMALSGETIDYGPCAFMDTFDPATVFSSIDHAGRYAFGNQPSIAQWNLARLAETLLPMISPDESEAVRRAEQAIGRFAQSFEKHWVSGMRAKLALAQEQPGDTELVESLLDTMRRHALDYTVSLRQLIRAADSHVPGWPAPLEQWRQRWLARLDKQPGGREEAARLCARTNPAVIPRNHLVEEALSGFVARADRGPLESLLQALADPYRSRPFAQRYERAPEHVDSEYRTFCGT